MNYTILLKRSVEKELERLDPKTHDKIIKKLARIERESFAQRCEKTASS